MSGSDDLLTLPVPRLLRNLALPVGVGYLFNTLFNVVDTFYAGRISTEAQAALSVSFPVFFLIIAVGGGISSGATALMGHALGAGDRDEACSYARQTVSFALLHGLLLTLLLLATAPQLFRLLGASGPYLQLSITYLQALASGASLFIVNQALNAILTATGNTRVFRNVLILGFFLNLLLDPWLIYGGLGLPPLGFAGVGWATVLIQGCASAYLLHHALGSGLLDRAFWRDLAPRLHPYRELARQGFPASLNMLTVALGIFVITWFVGRYGHQAVAAYGIATRIEQLALLPVMGLNVATLTLVAQNSGAGLTRRVHQTVRNALATGCAMMTAGAALVYLAAAPLVRLFSQDGRVISVGVSYLQIAAFVFTAYVILYICVFTLQGLKRPMFALWIGLYRQIAAPLLVFYLLSFHLGWGVEGIWWGILAVTWSAAIISLLHVRNVLARLPRQPAD